MPRIFFAVCCLALCVGLAACRQERPAVAPMKAPAIPGDNPVTGVETRPPAAHDASPAWPVPKDNRLFSPIDRQTLTGSETGPVVQIVMAGSLAAKMGVQAGDRLLAVGNLRVYDPREFELLRVMTSPLYAADMPARPQVSPEAAAPETSSIPAAELGPDALQLVFAHEDQIVTVLLDHLPPVREAGFTLRSAVEITELLRRWNIPVARQDVLPLSSFPQRAAILADAWRAEEANRAAETGWFAELVQTYLHLCRRQWNAVAKPGQEPPVKELKRLSDFYQALARNNQSGEIEPDWRAFGEGPEYAALYYPLPELSRARDNGRLYAYLDARCRIPPASRKRGYAGARLWLESHPAELADAYGRRTALWDEEMDLDDLIGDADFSHRRTELMNRVGDIARFGFSDKDAGRLHRLLRDGQGWNAYLQTLLRLSYWSHRQEEAPWVVPVLSRLMTVEEAKQWSEFTAALDALPWENETERAKQADALLDRYGMLAGRLLTADRFERHGMQDEAHRRRQEVVRFYERTLTLPPVRERAWPFWHALSVLSVSPATADDAIRYGQRYLELERESKRVDSAYLFLAQAYLLKDELSQAVEQFLASLDAANDPLVAYFLNGTAYTDRAAFCNALLVSMVNHAGWKPELSQRLLADRRITANAAWASVLESRPVVSTPEKTEVMAGTPAATPEVRKEVDTTIPPMDELFPPAKTAATPPGESKRAAEGKNVVAVEDRQTPSTAASSISTAARSEEAKDATPPLDANAFEKEFSK